MCVTAKVLRKSKRQKNCIFENFLLVGTSAFVMRKFYQKIWGVCSGPSHECPNLEEIHGKSWPDTGLEDVIHGT